MRMLRTVTVIVAFWLSVGQTPSYAQTYNGGQSSCMTWTDLRRTDRVAPEANWIHGFLIAVFLHEQTLTNHVQDVHEKDIVKWVDLYCGNNKTKTVGDAAQALEAHLRQVFSPPQQPPARGK